MTEAPGSRSDLLRSTALTTDVVPCPGAPTTAIRTRRPARTPLAWANLSVRSARPARSANLAAWPTRSTRSALLSWPDGCIVTDTDPLTSPSCAFYRTSLRARSAAVGRRGVVIGRVRGVVRRRGRRGVVGGQPARQAARRRGGRRGRVRRVHRRRRGVRRGRRRVHTGESRRRPRHRGVSGRGRGVGGGRVGRGGRGGRAGHRRRPLGGRSGGRFRTGCGGRSRHGGSGQGPVGTAVAVRHTGGGRGPGGGGRARASEVGLRRAATEQTTEEAARGTV